MSDQDVRIEYVAASDLRPHPRNYRQHPEDQLRHIERSLAEHGFYRPVVAARDLTILAGHGLVQAAARLGLERVPVIRLDLDPGSPQALKVLAGDNEIGKLAEVDDRALTELLREVAAVDVDALLGTGFDQAQLAALVMVTRPASEIRDFSAAAEWVGMPEYHEGSDPIKLVITFPSDADRQAFCGQVGLKLDKHEGTTYSTRWPWTDREDASSVRFETKE